MKAKKTNLSSLFFSMDGKSMNLLNFTYMGDSLLSLRTNIAITTKSSHSVKKTKTIHSEKTTWLNAANLPMEKLNPTELRRKFALRLLEKTKKKHNFQQDLYRSKKGKIMNINEDLGICFSASKNVSLVVIADTNYIGADIETFRKIKNIVDIISFTFSESESEMTTEFQKTFNESLNDSFLRVFSLKESYLKALGVGISFIKDFELEVRDGIPSVKKPLLTDPFLSWHLYTGSLHNKWVFSIALPQR